MCALNVCVLYIVYNSVLYTLYGAVAQMKLHYCTDKTMPMKKCPMPMNTRVLFSNDFFH